MRRNVHDVNIKPARKAAAKTAPKATRKAAQKTVRAPAKPSAAAPSYHHGNLRQALLQAGLALLEAGEPGERGEPSLRELARRVGVSANASYRHFADKEALLLALAAEGFRTMAAAQMKAAQAERQPLQRHRAAGAAYIRFARDNPALFRLMFGRFTSSHQGEELTQAGDLAFQALRLGVAQALELKPEDPAVMIAALHSWALVHGLSLLMLDGQIDQLSEDPEALIEAVLLQATETQEKRAKAR